MKDKLIEPLLRSIVPETMVEPLAEFLEENGVVIPTRCKDCKHAASGWVSINGGKGVMCAKFRNDWWDKRLNDDYCSYGERRTG